MKTREKAERATAWDDGWREQKTTQELEPIIPDNNFSLKLLFLFSISNYVDSCARARCVCECGVCIYNILIFVHLLVIPATGEGCGNLPLPLLRFVQLLANCATGGIDMYMYR